MIATFRPDSVGRVRRISFNRKGLAGAAELLRLGEQLDRVIADYNAQQLKDRAEREPFEVDSSDNDQRGIHAAPMA
jgi:hypothetical protein